jgi:peptide deformylase
MQIVYFPHPVLRQKSGEVTRIDDRFRALIREMFALMYEAKGVGLAANQIGIPLRFFIMNQEGDAAQPEHEHVFINPVIRNRKGAVVGEEGCLSLPGQYGDVRRAEEIVVEYFNLNGELLRATLQEYPARIVQHEYDHLEGVLFIDHLSPEALDEHQAKLLDMQSAYAADQAAGTRPADDVVRRELAAVAAKGELPGA